MIARSGDAKGKEFQEGSTAPGPGAGAWMRSDTRRGPLQWGRPRAEANPKRRRTARVSDKDLTRIHQQDGLLIGKDVALVRHRHRRAQVVARDLCTRATARASRGTDTQACHTNKVREEGTCALCAAHGARSGSRSDLTSKHTIGNRAHSRVHRIQDMKRSHAFPEPTPP
jgi:hypothetical protein